MQMNQWFKKGSLRNSFLMILFMMLFQCHDLISQSKSGGISMDSSIFVGWASSCEHTLGYQNIENPSVGYPGVGSNDAVVGQADGLSVLSLGDGGWATVQFSSPIVNAEGSDFAVFENSFSHNFLELAFVEVSSDGVNFVRFPSISNTQTAVQVGGFGTLDSVNIRNLAGKYIGRYGTPFDLDELKDIAGLNVNAITHVRVIDVVGSINPKYATYDSRGNVINDPWPTDFVSSGFDLDAVGVIHQVNTSVQEQERIEVSVYPNPVNKVLTFSSKELRFDRIQLLSLNGTMVCNLPYSRSINVSEFSSGVYFLKLMSSERIYVQRVVINHD